MKKCPPGQYYCTDRKKCMPIPRGYHVGRGGWLEKDKKNGNGTGSDNGNGNGNGNGGNGNGGNGNGNGGNGGGGMGESFINLPLNIEVPQTSGERKLGLMFRESLDYNSGMFFIFDEVGKPAFHMQNTSIPLDIAFINEDGTIESIKPLEPFSLERISSEGDILYALEVNRGWFAENDIKVGDQIFKDNVSESVSVPRQTGNVYHVGFSWKGKMITMKLFFPQIRKPKRKEIQSTINKVYPGSQLRYFELVPYQPGEPYLNVGK